MITEPEGQVSKRRFVFSDSVGAIAAWLAPRVEDRNFTIRASPVSAIPKVLFEDDHSLYLNGSAIHLKHHAYMSGDSPWTSKIMMSSMPSTRGGMGFSVHGLFIGTYIA